MPLVVNIYENSFRLSLWKLTEPLSFFEEKAHLSQADSQAYQNISNETRKKEWLAVRVMLNEVLGFWPNITYMETGKPILNNHTRHLSITHSKEMVGILLSTSPFAGVDLEKTARNIKKVLPRFLSAKELENVSVSNNPHSGIIHWCAKEAIFKSINEPNIEFSKRIIINQINDNKTINATFIGKDKAIEMPLNYMFVDDHVVVWVI